MTNNSIFAGHSDYDVEKVLNQRTNIRCLFELAFFFCVMVDANNADFQLIGKSYELYILFISSSWENYLCLWSGSELLTPVDLLIHWFL